MRKMLVSLSALAVAVFALAVGAQPSQARDVPLELSDLAQMKLAPRALSLDTSGPGGSTDTGGTFSVSQIERFRCASAGNPDTSVDMSCNTTQYNQDWNPDNEIAVTVDPENPNHVLAGSNDYFYRFNNSVGTRQAIVPTGFFTSFDGGATWIDGQIPLRNGNGAGDPSAAFDAKHDVAIMAQLENQGGLNGPFTTQGNVSVSRSTDGGVTWSDPVLVFHGHGASIGPANNALFYDKEWVTVDNHPASPFYGRTYLTTSRFLNGAHGSYAESPIWMSYSDDGGLTWAPGKEISGSNPSCTSQVSGGGTDCDEDQFSYTEVAADGTVYVHFLNSQNAAAWEVPNDMDSQIMVTHSNDGGASFTEPVAAAQLEDGFSDMPYSVIGSTTIWGHQLRWDPAGNISVNPNDPRDVTVVWSDRGTPNPNATAGCFDTAPGDAPNYDPCNAGPSSNTNVYISRSPDGGATWRGRQLYDGSPGHQWFPWADHKSDGTLAVAWDEDVQPAGGTNPVNDQFVHVLRTASGKQVLGPPEQLDISVTHWAGQYVPQSAWPTVCGPDGVGDPAFDAPGKDCNEFHGDYTGLAVDSLDRVHVTWTGLHRLAVSTQLDPYTGSPHDGYAQDAMYARR